MTGQKYLNFFPIMANDWSRLSNIISVRMRLFVPRHHDRIHATSLEFVLFEVLEIDYTATTMDHTALLSSGIPSSLMTCTRITEISGPRPKMFPSP